MGLGVFLVTLAGIPARATYGAQTSADEPQYLLTALSIAEDGDLDVANQRYSGAYRDFHEVLLPVQTLLQPDGSRISPHGPLLPLYLAFPMRIGGWVGAEVALAALAGLLLWVAVARFGVQPPVPAYRCHRRPGVSRAGDRSDHRAGDPDRGLHVDRQPPLPGLEHGSPRLPGPDRPDVGVARSLDSGIRGSAGRRMADRRQGSRDGSGRVAGALHPRSSRRVQLPGCRKVRS